MLENKKMQNKYEVLGVYEKRLIPIVARAAKKLGAKRVLVICSQDGYDEISPCAKTDAMFIDENNNEKAFVIDPAAFGVTGCVEEECWPYSSQGGVVEECKTSCPTGKEFKKYRAPTTEMFFEVSDFLHDLPEYGPITSQLTVYSDFLNYNLKLE